MSSLRNTLRYFYHHTPLGKLVLRPFIYYRDYIMPAETYVRKRFKRVMGYPLDLEHPKTLNEKINWLKLYGHSPLHTQCADKYKVREYVADKIGEEYLVPLYFETKDPAAIRPENLPEVPVIVKTNHDSGGGEIIRDKTKADYPAIREAMKKRLKLNYYYPSKEPQYKDIEKRIIVEQLLIDQEGRLPDDYKIHCLNGKPAFVQVDLDRFTDHRRNLYDFDWNLLPFTWSVWKNGKPEWPNGREIARPERLADMERLAARLSEDFDYARVDFYISDGQLYFGEITFHHGGGTEIFDPVDYDRKFGELLEIAPDREGRQEG